MRNGSGLDLHVEPAIPSGNAVAARGAMRGTREPEFSMPGAVTGTLVALAVGFAALIALRPAPGVPIAPSPTAAGNGDSIGLPGEGISGQPRTLELGFGTATADSPSRSESSEPSVGEARALAELRILEEERIPRLLALAANGSESRDIRLRAVKDLIGIHEVHPSTGALRGLVTTATAPDLDLDGSSCVSALVKALATSERGGEFDALRVIAETANERTRAATAAVLVRLTRKADALDPTRGILDRMASADPSPIVRRAAGGER